MSINDNWETTKKSKRFHESGLKVSQKLVNQPKIGIYLLFFSEKNPIFISKYSGWNSWSILSDKKRVMLAGHHIWLIEAIAIDAGVCGGWMDAEEYR